MGRNAADAARMASGFEAAAALLGRAIDKLEREGGDAALRCELLLEQGVDRFCAGQVNVAWGLLGRAAEAARALGHAGPLAECAFRLADCLEMGTDDERVVQKAVDDALQLLGDADAALRATLLAHRAEVATELPTPQRLQLLDEAQALAVRSDNPEVLLDVAHSRAILRDPVQLEQSLQAADHFLSLMERHPEAVSSMRYRSLRRFGAHLTQYLCALSACDLPAADAALARCRATSEGSQMRALTFTRDLLQAGRAGAEGRLSELQQILQRLGDAPDPATIMNLAWQAHFFDLLEAQGKLDTLAHFEATDPWLLQGVSNRLRLVSAMKLTNFYAKTQRPHKARELLAQLAPSMIDRMPSAYGDLGLLCELAQAHVLLHEPAGAQRLYAVLLPFAQRNALGPAFEYRGAVAHYLGLLSRLLGEPARAQAHLHAALQINRSLRMPLAVTQTERALAG